MRSFVSPLSRLFDVHSVLGAAGVMSSEPRANSSSMTLARDSTSGVAFGVALGVALVSALVSLSPAARLRLLRWAKGLQDAHTPSVL